MSSCGLSANQSLGVPGTPGTRTKPAYPDGGVAPARPALRSPGPPNEGEVMRTLRLALAVLAGIAVVAPATALAGPPSPPPGCTVVLTTPAATTGSAQGMAQKMATFERVCLGS